MNEEIKEILEYLKDEKWDYYPSDMTPYKVLVMEERDKLLDYITDLQQKYERLKKDVELFKSDLINSTNTGLSLIAKIDKTIEYIDEMCKFGNKYACHGYDLNPEYIIKVLQGSEDNER